MQKNTMFIAFVALFFSMAANASPSPPAMTVSWYKEHEQAPGGWRGSRNFKVVSKTGYKEVQVDGATGKVLNVADRNDQFIEQLHDFSWFHDLAHQYGLPVVALGLLFLAGSGIGIFFVPIIRRRKFQKLKK